MKYLKLLFLLKDWRKQALTDKGRMPKWWLSKTFLGATATLIIGALALWGVNLDDSVRDALYVIVPGLYFFAMFVKGIIDRVRRGKSILDAIGETGAEIGREVKSVQGDAGEQVGPALDMAQAGSASGVGNGNGQSGASTGNGAPDGSAGGAPEKDSVDDIQTDILRKTGQLP